MNYNKVTMHRQFSKDNQTVDQYVKAHLTQQQVYRCKEAFDSFDINRNNRIEINELEAALINMGHKPTEDELNMMMNEDNEEGESSISWDRFITIIAKQKEALDQKMRADMLDAFVALGGQEDGQGVITMGTLTKIIKKEFGMTFDIMKLVDEFDEDGSGQIDFQTFINMMSD